MNISRKVKTLCSKSLSESMDVRTMYHVARRLIPEYDIYKETGFPSSFAIPNRDAADTIIRNITEADLFFRFIETLIRIQREGIMSKKVTIPYLNDILKEIYANGYLFDNENQILVEDSRVRKTKNWGTLQEGESYTLAFLGIDIIDNTGIVQKYPRETVERTYTEFSYIVQNITEGRDGRLWTWEGDGGVIAFFRGNKYQNAVLSALEILNSLLLYNHTICTLNEHLHFRISIHSGECEYTENMELLVQTRPIKMLHEMEKKYSGIDAICISFPVKMMLDEFISKQFIPLKNKQKNEYFQHTLQWAQHD